MTSLAPEQEVEVIVVLTDPASIAGWEDKATDFEKKWIAALESGKYKQTQSEGWVQYENPYDERSPVVAYCCLAVAAVEAELVPYTLSDRGIWRGEVEKLAPVFDDEWDNRKPTEYRLEDRVIKCHDPITTMQQFIKMNDAERLTFTEIAACARGLIALRTEKPVEHVRPE